MPWGVCDDATWRCCAALRPLEGYAARFDDLFGQVAQLTRQLLIVGQESEPLVRGQGVHRAEVAPVEREHRIGPVPGR